MDYDIVIRKFDDVYLRVECEPGIAFELRDYFSFMSKNYKYDKRYRSGKWDGRIRLFNLVSRKMYTGLIYELISFCIDHEYDFQVEEGFDIGEVPQTHVRPFLPVLQLPFEPYDYQIEAVETILTRKRRLVLSPTASGKSLIIYLAMHKLFDEELASKVLIVVPNTSLVEQLASDFDDYAQNVPWSSDEYVHKIYDYNGVTYTTDKPIVITTWQSVYKRSLDWFAEYDAVFVDEAHQASAASLKGILEKLPDCPYRVGLTGTIDDGETHRLTLQGLFGKIYRTTTTREMIDSDRASDLAIKGIILKHRPEQCQRVSKGDYTAEIDVIIDDETRNTFISNLALNHKGNGLVLFRFVERHGEVLANMISERAEKYGKVVFYVHGGVPTKSKRKGVIDREYIRKYAEEHDNVIIVASFGTFSTGINIKNLQYAIFAHPYKAKIKNLQSIGRLLRKTLTSTHAILYDIADDFTWKKKVNTVLKHFKARLGYYDQEEHDYSITQLEI